MKTVVQVPVLEYERGWGSKIDDFMICTSVEDAKKFIEEFNSHNDKSVVPDWYMVAYDNILPIDITDNQFVELIESESKRLWKRGFID